MSDAIRSLEPRALWNCFADLNAVPRPSKKESQVKAFVRDFAAKHALECLEDSGGNLIVKKAASTDRTGRGPVILQAHLDMVHKAADGVSFDFENQGIEKSQFAILQGLMKLRQICDSPAILKDETKYENHSTKLDELLREMQENIGEHKVLIFSQFLGMLSLIKDTLTQNDIKYQYFDGSYTAQQRETAIRDFQDNPECRAFLISLKAGGMGLNLTAADYVYIVDPWWNPAVEQQAIDRTHRIGQTKNIFAYRLICKDTVEEKIMILKDKKNTLVKDIVSDDTQMIKQLTREDVNYLFS